jgi:hypothetical protein
MRNPSSNPSIVARAVRQAVSIVSGATGRSSEPTTNVELPHFAGTRFSSSTSSAGIGIGFFEVSVLSGSEG